MASTTTSQLNVRMDSELRSAGDAVLDRLGVTPAEVVRALWARVAEGVQECEQVLLMLADKGDSPVSTRGDEFLAQIENWHSDLLELAEVDRSTYVAPTDEELDVMLYDEWLHHHGRTAV